MFRVRMFFGSTMVMVTVALVMAVIVTNIYAKKDSKDRAPIWCLNIASKFYPISRKSVCVSDNKNVASTEKANDVPQRIGATTIPIRPTWADNATPRCSLDPSMRIKNMESYGRNNMYPFVDRPTCNYEMRQTNKLNWTKIFTKSTNLVATTESKRSMKTFNCTSVNCSIGNVETNDKTQVQNPADQDVIEIEWRILAKFTDRIFFWIFLALSTLTQLTLFKQMVPE
ncbi:hypothetical protein HELRODRAFT_181170 [Helobdella robusta]|uniref:Neurotransmitter-gated ion-channel transmembrane domain-containing protein n=1 Tax=Helobdella robusta TaxID=6412 RepID=T1FGP8_HELRO|nr:hypothetical protein HELRODRAFT_181170 [Helobdella robusta]ESN93235.1 hypothetical protein HELRODRAFT_181170 [Helobdella robusta]